jgi:hypothetical protein
VDTRSKILPWEEALHLLHPSSDVRIVTGYFDPLLAAHAARLRELSAADSQLLVIVTHPPNPLLPACARAELLAALSVVDLVTVAPSDAPLMFPDGLRLIREEAHDAARTRELVRHVHRRHGERQAVADG